MWLIAYINLLMTLKKIKINLKHSYSTYVFYYYNLMEHLTLNPKKRQSNNSCLTHLAWVNMKDKN